MVRLKFVVFALVALAIAGLQLFAVSPTIGAPAESLALEAARNAALAARGEVVRQKQALIAFALEARTSAPVVEVLTRQASARTPSTPEERLEQLREPILASLPEEQRGEVLLWLVAEGAGAKATATEPAAAAEVAELDALATASSQALLHLLNDAPHLVATVPLRPAAGTLVMAVPLSSTVLAPVAPNAGRIGVALLADGKVIASSGPVAAGELESSLAKVKAGSGAVVARAHSGMLGPVALPVLAGAPAEQTAQRVGFRVDAGEGLEAAAVAELSNLQGALAGGQRTALTGLAGLLVLTLVWTLIMGTPRPAKDQDEAGDEDAAPLRASLSVLPLASKPEAGAAPAVGQAQEASSGGTTPTPDDFQFPPAGSPTQDDDAAQALAAGTGWTPPPSQSSQPSRSFTPAPAFTPAPQEAAPAAYGRAPAPETAATPVPQAAPSYGYPPPVASQKPLDPFGMVSQGSTHDSYYGEDNPDATRVAAVPKELLQASASSMPSSAASVVSRPLGVVPTVAAPAGDPDEEHFHAVFNDFVSTRASCGEPADGVTYEKFALKLRKNRDQLVQKYACRTVRFQVYVKDGKAALKATPVKD